MKKIYLFCAAGMSTSLLVTKMQEAAKELSFDCTIEAHPVSEVSERAKDADVVLLGPQVRFQLNKVKEQCTCPVEAIDMRAYGMMDGKAVISHVIKVLEK